MGMPVQIGSGPLCSEFWPRCNRRPNSQTNGLATRFPDFGWRPLHWLMFPAVSVFKPCEITTPNCVYRLRCQIATPNCDTKLRLTLTSLLVRSQRLQHAFI